MPNKHNLVLYLDKELIEKSKELGLNLSKTFENHLKQLITRLSKQQSTQNYLPTENTGHDMGLPVPEPKRVQNLTKIRMLPAID